MIITGTVLNSSTEDRELTGKDGTKRMSKIAHVLLSVKTPNGGVEIVNLRCYDPKWTLPKLGSEWGTPPIRRYENFDGQVADVVVGS